MHIPPPLVPTQATPLLGKGHQIPVSSSSQSERSRDRAHHSRRGPTVMEVMGQGTLLPVGPHSPGRSRDRAHRSQWGPGVQAGREED